MCKPISCILTKDRVLFSDKSHSHDDILEENHIRDDSETPSFVKIELYPEDEDMFSRPEKWKYEPDQDVFPDWYVREVDEPRVREAAGPYIAAHIHINESGLVLSAGMHWVKDCKDVSIKGGAILAEVRSSTIQDVWDGTIQDVRGGTIRNVWDGTIQDVRGGTIQDVRGGTIRNVWDGTIQDVRGGTIRNVRGGTIRNVWDGTIQDVRGGTIRNVWDGTIRNVWDGTIQDVRGGTIQDVWDGTIQDVRGGTIRNVWDGTIQDVRGGTIRNVRGNANLSISEYSKYTAENIILCEDATLRDFRTHTIYHSGAWKLVAVEAKKDATV